MSTKPLLSNAQTVQLFQEKPFDFLCKLVGGNADSKTEELLLAIHTLVQSRFRTAAFFHHLLRLNLNGHEIYDAYRSIGCGHEEFYLLVIREKLKKNRNEKTKNPLQNNRAFTSCQF